MSSWHRRVFGAGMIALPLIVVWATGFWPFLPVLIGEISVCWVIGFGAILHLDRRFHRWIAAPPDCTENVRNLLETIAHDLRFLRIAGLGTASPELAAFQSILQTATVMHSPSLQGGFAGLGCGGGVVLALSRLHLRIAAAAHELFHLARHVRGTTPFEQEDQMGLFGVMIEEGKVWWLTAKYTFLRGCIELMVHCSIYFLPPAYLILRLIFPNQLW